jgi:soluble lytic murein transglycosylase-like protein
LINEKSHIIIPKKFKDEYIKYIYKESLKNNIPIDIMFRLIYKESYFNIDIKSSANAYGLMQIRDNTYEFYGICNSKEKKNVYNNIDIGIKHLLYLRKYWENEKKMYSKTYIWKLTLASYNAGLENIKYYKGFPPFKETNDYIRFILKFY